MKTIFLCLLLIFTTTINAQQLSKDEITIKKVIEDETAFYCEQNYEAWSKLWVHSATIHWASISPDNYTEFKSWDKLSEYIKNEFEQYPDTLKWHPQKTDYKFHIEKNIALVTLKEDGNACTRVLTKGKDGWKIIQMTVVKTDAFEHAMTISKLKNVTGWWVIDPASVKIKSPWAQSIDKLNCKITQSDKGFAINSKFVMNAGEAQWHYWEEKILTVKHEVKEIPVLVRAGGEGWSNVCAGHGIFKDGKLVLTYFDVLNPLLVTRKESYTLKSSGILHLEGKYLDEKGEETGYYSYDLIRKL